MSEQGDADLWLRTKSATGAFVMRNGVKCPQNRSTSDFDDDLQVVISKHHSYPTLYDLHLFSFKTPTSWADLSEEGDADCALEMRNGVNDYTGHKEK